MHVNRRDLLASIAASTVLAACSKPSGHPAKTGRTSPAVASSASTGHPDQSGTTHAPQTPQHFAQQAIPDHLITTVPSGPLGHPQIALTIDDGVNADVVAGYAQLCHRTGIRLTFFANGRYDSWRINRNLLAPLVESGQVVIGNHTLDHPDIRRRNISAKQLDYQIRENEKVFKNLYGSTCSLAPYFRPPYGFYDHPSLAQVRSLGYTAIVMWYGTTGDEQNISSATIMKNLETWSKPGQIIIGHANHPGVLKDFDRIRELFEARHLTTVTVADVYPKSL